MLISMFERCEIPRYLVVDTLSAKFRVSFVIRCPLIAWIVFFFPFFLEFDVQ